MIDLSQLPFLISAGRWQEAETLLKKASRRKECPAELHYNLGKVYEQLGKTEKIGPCFLQAVQKLPDYSIAWFELGRWQVAQNQLDRALASFQKVVALSPADQDAWRNVGRLGLRLGLWAVAKDAWEKLSGEEADQALYRIAAETGDETAPALLSTLLEAPSARPRILKEMVRTAKGRIPLRL
ncbi:tetratricopeptide repeat protein [Flexibacterium corallicola]|uniref:tetratricopeptide repeat protein n=1 Tax=Flexibacterium corallicola TaxID=3037259 RepID=UPI00286ED0DE|nr:tetratricopeptide repeat protein [Pseudovibrio sp. M1P-2-3]